MTCSSSSLDVFELEDDVPDGWYLQRFGDGKRMVIYLQPISYIGQSICKSRLVSSNHAVIRLLENGSWYIKDLDSKYGTYVNDKIVSKEGLILDEWDVICLGRKRPRNANEFGFMLKYKEDSESEKSTKTDRKSRSCSTISTVDKKHANVLSMSSESTKSNLSKEKKFKPNLNHSINGSVIVISDDTPESSKSENSSEKTVKLTPNMPFEIQKKNHREPVLEGNMITVEEKINNWLTKQKSGKSRKPRSKKHVDQDYVPAGDNYSDNDPPSEVSSKRYDTRTKNSDVPCWIVDALSSGSGSESNDTKKSKVSEASQTSVKMPKQNSKELSSSEDDTWKPYTRPKYKKRRKL